MKIIIRYGLPFALVATTAIAATQLANYRPGYISDRAFDILNVLPPAPVKGDAHYEADRQIFKATRQMIGSPRYQLATRDVDHRDPAMMANFSCAVGVALTPENAPKTKALIDRAMIDTSAQMTRAKDYYKRSRPFNIDEGEICEPKSTLTSYDYPSGHTTLGWTWALVLTDLQPERAAAIEARGRAYGESRYICGAHNESAVEAGTITATATMAVVQTTQAYQEDASAARIELHELVANPNTPKASGCKKEAQLVAQHGPR